MNANYVLGVRRRQEGATDSHGNPVATYSAAADWAVWALAPGASAEPGQQGRDLSLIAWTVYAPKGDDAPGVRDRVVLDGREFEVDGEHEDWTRGPWPHPTAGIVVLLRLAEG